MISYSGDLKKLDTLATYILYVYLSEGMAEGFPIFGSRKQLIRQIIGGSSVRLVQHISLN